MVGRLFILYRLSHEGIPGRPWETTVYQLLLKGHVFAWHIHSWRKNWISSLVGCSCQFLPSSIFGAAFSRAAPRTAPAQVRLQAEVPGDELNLGSTSSLGRGLQSCG